VLDELRLTSRALGLSELEEKRATRSLTKVLDRLRRREYERFAFDGNVFDLPDRVKELLTELEFYCSVGKTWARVLDALDATRYPVIADLCPGYAPKIELALFYLGYEGEVCLVNKDHLAFEDLEKFIALFSPKFSLRRVQRDLWSEPVDAFPLIAANHILDDLVADHYSSRFGFLPGEIYEREGRLVELWDRILERRDEHLAEMSDRFAGVFERMLAPGGRLAVAQYESYVERILDLGRVTAFNKELLERIRSALVERGLSDETALADRALEAVPAAERRFGPGEQIVVAKKEAP
jgi:hypothetical protein